MIVNLFNLLFYRALLIYIILDIPFIFRFILFKTKMNLSD